MKCTVCGSAYLNQIISFGSIPLCDDVRADKVSALNVQSFPITVVNCEECNHSELLFKPSEDLIYANYTYRTSLSPLLDSHFEKAAKNIDSVCKKYDRQRSDPCFVDIGGNDGVLASKMQSRGFCSFIIDPSPTARYCGEGIRLYNEYFDSSIVERFIAENGGCDIIACNNCIANVRDLHAFAQNISNLLVEGGFVFIETGYLVDQMQSCAAEMINHEHYHYFSMESMSRLFKEHGLSAVAYERLPTKGGSFRYIGQKKGSGINIVRENHYEYLDHISFNAKCASRKNTIMDIVANRKTDFFGASAGSTILTYLMGLNDHIECIFDDNLTRQGMYMPGSGAKINSPDEWYENHGDICINMAWRFGQEIRERHGEFLPDSYLIVDII